VTRALSFLVNDAKLKHNNLHSASVFVTEAGDWKLAGLEYVTGADQEPPLKILPGLEKYEPPERSKVQKNQYRYPNTVSLAF
jgi:SCY1-like protein 1